MTTGSEGNTNDAWILVLVVTVFFSSLWMIRPFVPVFAEELGAQPMTVGFVVTVRVVSALIAAIFTNALANRFGLRATVGMGIVLSAVALWLLSLFAFLPMLFFTQFLTGVGETVTVISTQMFVANMIGGGTSESKYGIYAAAVSTGQLIGPYIGGIAYSALNPPVAFGLAGGLSMVSLVGLNFLSPHKPFVESPRVSHEAKQSLSGSVGLVIGAAFLAEFGIATFEAFYPLYLSSIGFSAVTIGAFFSMRGATALTVRLSLAQFVRLSRGRTNCLLGSLAIIGIVIPLMAASSLPNVAAALILLIGVGHGLTQPLSMLMVADHAREGALGLALGLRTMANRVAGLSAPFLLGGVIQSQGFMIAFATAGLVVLLGSAVLWRSRDSLASPTLVNILHD